MRVGDEMRKVDGGSGESSGLELELEELLRVRQRFLWTFSHELRTPLNVILCYNDLMTSGVLGPLNERQELATTRMAASITQLKELVEGVFELSEIESRSVSIVPERVSLRDLVREVYDELERVARGRGLYLEVEFEDEVEVVSDRGKLRRILIHLCTNALQFTNEGGVRVRVRRDAERARIDIIDTSDGLDEEGVEALFEDSGWYTPSGSHAGLNLTLAYRLATLLEGEIKVSSRKGFGSVFSLLLPVRTKVVAGG